VALTVIIIYGRKYLIIIIIIIHVFDSLVYHIPNFVTSSFFSGVQFSTPEIFMCVMDWIGLAQDMNRWRAVVNSVLNLRVP
jgi:hypothetical protein